MENFRVGQRISEARNRLGMSTQQLAENIDKSQATVSRIENGKQGVTLPLLAKIAQVLRIHPFSLLGFKLYGEYFENQQGVLLQYILKSGRLRARLSQESAARQIKVDALYLDKIEQGVALPTPQELGDLCTLYSLDEHYATQVLRAEKEYPELVTKLYMMNGLLGDCLDVLEATRNFSDKNFLSLKNRIEDCLSSCSSEERRAQYFSIGHLSDKLLAALQNPEFHQKAEDLARQWSEKDAATSAPEGEKQEDPHYPCQERERQYPGADAN